MDVFLCEFIFLSKHIYWIDRNDTWIGMTLSMQNYKGDGVMEILNQFFITN